LQARDLLAAVPLDLEQHERDALRLGELREPARKHRRALLVPERRFRTDGRAHEVLLDLPPRQEEPKPPQAPEVAHAVPGDLIEPSGEVLPVELGQAAVHDEKDVLHEIGSLGVRCAERTSPSVHFVEVPAVDLFESDRVERRELRHARLRTKGAGDRAARLHALIKGSLRRKLFPKRMRGMGRR